MRDLHHVLKDIENVIARSGPELFLKSVATEACYRAIAAETANAEFKSLFKDLLMKEKDLGQLEKRVTELEKNASNVNVQVTGKTAKGQTKNTAQRRKQEPCS